MNFGARCRNAKSLNPMTKEIIAMAGGKKYFNLFDWLAALRTRAKAFLDVFVPLAGTKDLPQKLRMFERLEPRAMLASWGQVQAGQLVGADGKFSDAANWWDGVPPNLVNLGHAPGAEDPLSFEASGLSRITIDSNQTVSSIGVMAGQTTLVLSKKLTVSNLVAMQTSWLVADPGPVALTIQSGSGGSVSSDGIALNGQSSNGNGNLSLTLNGITYSVVGLTTTSLVVNAKAAQVTVAKGSLLSAGSGAINVAQQWNGTLTVTGKSVLTGTGPLNVGNPAPAPASAVQTASVAVKNGGTLTAGSVALNNSASLSVNNGTATTSGDLVVGGGTPAPGAQAQTASVTAQNGGKVTAGTLYVCNSGGVAVSAGSSLTVGTPASFGKAVELVKGTMTLSGQGATATIGGILYVGYRSGPAKLIVNNGATLTTTSECGRG
jgi:hypothetical protein